MKKLVFTLSLVSLFFISWAVTRAVSPSSCINSNFVNKLVIFDESQKATVSHIVPGCSFENFFMQRGSWPRDRMDILSRVKKLEALKDILSTHKKLDVYISQSDPFVFKKFDQAVVIGMSLAEQGRYLEQIIIDKHLNINAKGDSVSQFISEMLSRFLIATVIGPEQVTDPLTGYLVPNHDLTLDKSLLSHEEYCHNSLMSPNHIEMCAAQNTSQKRARAKWMAMMLPTYWGLRSFISASLYDYYQKMDIGEKSDFAENFTERLRTHKFEASRSFVNYKIVSFESAKFWLNLFVSTLFQDSFGDLNNNRMVAILDARNAFYTQTYDFEFKYIDDSYTPDVMSGHLQPEKSFIVKTGESTLLSNFVAIPEWFRHNYTSDEVVLIGCLIPDPYFVLSMGLRGKRAVFIKTCQTGVVSFVDIANLGVEEYLKQNKEVEFMKIHLPSLKLALAAKSINDYGPANLAYWQDILNWQGVEWDSQSASFEPKAEFDGITNFRFVN